MIKDSGERTEFSTGAVRDMKRGVGRMDLLPWYGIMEVSKHCEEGAEKYGEHNVDKGIPLHSLCDSAARHLAKFICGELDEDHLRAACWNLLWALNQRKTHPELDDLYSHKEMVEKVRNVIDEFNKAKENGELVFTDIESTVDETCGEALRPLTRDEILQRCREAQDVYVISKSETIWSGRCYLQFAIPDNECDPLSVFMYPLEGEGHTPFLYTPEEFEVYDTYPSPKSLKKTKDNDIKPKEPTAIEPLSKELLLGMNGRFVYLVLNNNGIYMDIGWVRIRVDGNDIIIAKDDNEGNTIWEKPWVNGKTNCYVTDPKLLGKDAIHD